MTNSAGPLKIDRLAGSIPSIFIAACLILLGCLQYPAMHIDTLSHTLPGLEYARTGLLESPLWHMTYEFSPNGEASYYYHGFLYPFLIGRLGLKELPQAIALIGWLNGTIVIAFSLVTQEILLRSSRLARWPQIAASQFSLAFPLASWLLYLQGRPETLCLLIMGLSSAALLVTPSRKIDGIVLGVGSSLCLLTSPVFGVNTFLMFLAYLVFRCKTCELLRCFAILSCATLMSAIIGLVALFPGNPLHLISGISMHGALMGGRSLSLVPRIWIQSWEFPGIGLLLVASLYLVYIQSRKLSIEPIKHVALYMLMAALSLLLCKTSISFSPKIYNASPLIAFAFCYLSWIIGSARRITPWIAAILALAIIPGLGFVKHLRQATDFQVNGTKWSELRRSTQAFEDRLSPGELIGFSPYSRVAWAGLSDFKKGRTISTEPERNNFGPLANRPAKAKPRVRFVFNDAFSSSQVNQVKRIGTGGVGHDYGATVVILEKR